MLPSEGFQPWFIWRTHSMLHVFLKKKICLALNELEKNSENIMENGAFALFENIIFSNT